MPFVDPVEFGMMEGSMGPVEKGVFSDDDDHELHKHCRDCGPIFHRIREQKSTNFQVEDEEEWAVDKVIKKNTLHCFFEVCFPLLVVSFPGPWFLSSSTTYLVHSISLKEWVLSPVNKIHEQVISADAHEVH